MSTPAAIETPVIRSWTRPVTIPFCQLAETISGAWRDGFAAVRLEALTEARYRVAFQWQSVQDLFGRAVSG